MAIPCDFCSLTNDETQGIRQALETFDMLKVQLHDVVVLIERRRAAEGRNEPTDPESSHWFWMENAVVDRIGEIGPLGFAVYGIIVRHGGDKRQSYPSISTLACACNASERSIRRALVA